MVRTRRLLALVPLVALLAACGGAATQSGAVPPETVAEQTMLAGADLVGAVGPGFTITLQQDSADVTALKAGTYTLAISDQAATHDFALRAPDGTVTQITDVPFTGTKQATIKLTPGEWAYFCQPHASQMRGTFTVS